MATKKIQVALSSAITSPVALAAIKFDGAVLETNIEVIADFHTPLIKEYTVEVTGEHTLTIEFLNDYYDGTVDQNLYVNYVKISDEQLVFPPYDYLISGTYSTIESISPAGQRLATIWGAGNTVDLVFDGIYPSLWHDYAAETAAKSGT